MTGDAKRLCLVVCDFFKCEVESVLTSEGFDDVEVFSYPARCGLPPLSKEEIGSLTASLKETDTTCVLGGRSCTKALPVSTEEAKGYFLHRLDQCSYMLAGKSLIDNYLKEGCYLLTPGWLSQWKAHIKEMGGDRETVRDLFGESCRKLLLLDTLVDVGSRGRLLELSGYLEKPYEIVPVGLDHLRLLVREIVMKWRGKAAKEDRADDLGLFQRRQADFAMAMDLLSELSHTFVEDEITRIIEKTFSMLFAPESVRYLSIREGRPDLNLSDLSPERVMMIERLLITGKSLEVNGEGDGFAVSIKYQDDTVGLMLVSGIALPVYLDHYIDLSTYITGICGLSIGNARRIQSVQETKAQFARHTFEMINSPGDGLDLLKQVVELIRNFSGFDAISLRMQSGGGLRCQAFTGFGADFIEAENPFYELCAGGEGGAIIDVTDCTTLLLQPPSYKAFFSEYGSFRVNNVSEFLTASTARDIYTRLCQHYNKEGYDSFALIPLRVDKEQLWLMQVADRKKDVFTPEIMAYYESIIFGAVTVLKKREVDQAIKASLNEKTLLLREIHHRVKNNLQVISALLQIQLDAYNNGVIKPLDEIICESKNRIKSMAVIYDLLHDSKDLTCINILECIDTIGRDLLSAFGMKSRVGFKITGRSVDLGLDQAVPCALIANELITNALKHAFPEDKKGAIEVAITEKGGGEVVIVISDDGVGIPECIDWKEPVSVGLELVNGLAGQIEASIELDRSSGTRFALKFESE